MATVKEKEEALRALVGDDLASQVMNQAGSREKAAEESGVAFKAKGDKPKAAPKPEEEPEKPEAKKPEAKKPEADDEDSGEDGSDELDALLAEIEAEEARGENSEEEESESEAEENSETPEDEAAEEKPEEKQPEKKPVTKKKEAEEAVMEDAADAEESEKEASLFMGDILVEDFADMMATGLATALQPYFNQMSQMGERVKEISEKLEITLKELKDQAETTAKEKNGAVDKAEAALKEAQSVTAEITKLRDGQVTLAKAVTTTQKRLKQLDEGMTPAAKEFVASQAEETVLKDDNPLRESHPAADPVADFTKNFIFPQGN